MHNHSLHLRLVLLSALFGLAAAHAAQQSFRPAAPALFDLKFTKDYFPGTRDVNGQWSGGTETLELCSHNGKLFASIGYWMDEPYLEPKGDEPWTGAQVLVKDSATAPWRVDVSFGKEYKRTEALVEITFTTDAKGAPLTPPVRMLVAAPDYIDISREGWATAWTRDDSTGKWQKSDIAHERYQPSARSLTSYRDKVTGIHHIFAGVSRGAIYRGVYDPTAPGRLRWNDKPELEGTGRVLAFAEANGVLYAACSLKNAPPHPGGIYRRIDGPQPKWELVYRWPFRIIGRSTEWKNMRGLTAVPDPKGGGHQVLLAARSYGSVIERIDPAKNFAVTAELNIRDFFAKQWGLTALRGPVLAAYNRIVPVTHPVTGEKIHLIGVAVAHPKGDTPPHNGSYFLIRRADGRYEAGEIYDPAHPVPAGSSLVATRAIEVSPFPEDRGRVFYFGGYDCGFRKSHNTAWIYRGEIQAATAKERTISAPIPALLPLDFKKDYFPGTKDAAGKFMGGTETVRLIGHGGRLFAGIGFWNDAPDGDPRRRTLGAQVLRKDLADAVWVVDRSWGKTYWRVNAMLSVTFTADAEGKPLVKPASLLLAAIGGLGGDKAATVWVRDDAGRWTESVVATGHGYARSLIAYRDKVTGRNHLFAGTVKGIVRGSYDPASPGKIRWEPRPEIEGHTEHTFQKGNFTRTYHPRTVAFAEVNGRLYASQQVVKGSTDEGGLLVRTDGPNPSWQVVYRRELPPQAVTGYTAFRGITAIPHPKHAGKQAILGAWEWSGLIELVDPLANHAVTQELDVLAHFKAAFGSLKKPAIFPAYNEFTPFTHPGNGSTMHLCGIWVWPPGWDKPPTNGSWFLIRRADGSYEHQPIYDPAHPLPEGQSLGACRTITVSPFPEDRGRVLYFGGYDAGAAKCHNTAWIYKGTLK